MRTTEIMAGTRQSLLLTDEQREELSGQFETVSGKGVRARRTGGRRSRVAGARDCLLAWGPPSREEDEVEVAGGLLVRGRILSALGPRRHPSQALPSSPRYRRRRPGILRRSSRAAAWAAVVLCAYTLSSDPIARCPPEKALLPDARRILMFLFCFPTHCRSKALPPAAAVSSACWQQRVAAFFFFFFARLCSTPLSGTSERRRQYANSLSSFSLWVKKNVWLLDAFGTRVTCRRAVVVLCRAEGVPVVCTGCYARVSTVV